MTGKATDLDAVVVGAGVVGLAIGRALSQSGLDTLVIESQPRHGMGTSSRNSGVIHAGLYYPPGSNKASWCVRGRELLYAFCQSHQVAHKQLGKLIVGQDEDEAALQTIASRAKDSGVTNLRWLTQQELKAMEPEVRARHALFSPSTGIVDVHELMLALEGDIEKAGSNVVTQSCFLAASLIGTGVSKGWQLDVKVGQDERHGLSCQLLINAAGLDADAVASRIEGLATEHIPKVHFAKGNYASLTGSHPFKHLVYPAPVPGGLGTHLTLNIAGEAQFGPDVEWLGPADPHRLPGSTHPSLNYAVNTAQLADFAASVQRWWPSLRAERLQPGYSGIRPKLTQNAKEPAADFVLQGPDQHGLAGLVNLFGIESPGLTACLAIGEAVHHCAKTSA
ncbi:MAG: NAD(P)/FAD-dependent oxidoreductase [Burkholderiaceae bacterium]